VIPQSLIQARIDFAMMTIMIKGIIFDLDDTLLKTQQTKFRALKAAGKQFYNQDITDEHLLAHWGKPFPVLMDELFLRAEPTDRLIANYMSIVRNFQNQAYDDALRAISGLGQTYHLGILSSASRDLVLHDLQTSGFDADSFVHIQSANDTLVHKPDPAVFQPLLQRFANETISAEHLLYIGDMESDYLASTGAGLHFVGIARTPAQQAMFSRIGAPSIASLEALQAYVERL